MRHVDFEKFINLLFSNTIYKNLYGFYFEPLLDISSRSGYIRPRVEGCLTRWRVEKG
jgi:hypothetical protein